MKARARRERAIVRDRRRDCRWHPLGAECWNCYEPPAEPWVFTSFTAFDAMLVRLYGGRKLRGPEVS